MYLYGLGKRNPKTEFRQIIWFLNARCKNKNDAYKTALLLDVNEQYFNLFLDNECYEMLAYLKSHLTDGQIEKRIKLRIKQKISDLEYWNKWQLWLEQQEAKERLLSSYSAN